MVANFSWLHCFLFLILPDVISSRDIHFGPCVLVVNGHCPDTDNIRTYIYTRSNPDDPQFVTLDNITTSQYKPHRPNKLIIHGYNADMYQDSLQQIKTEYLKLVDANVWTVNWPSLCKGPCYPFAVYNLGHVGQCLAQLVVGLRRLVGTLDLHVIGFSLGAHVGNYMALSLAPYKIPRITGLDPAMPLFMGRDNDRKLDKSDAEFVDIIHTNALVQGTVEETGHVDFFVNGGVNQPGCNNESNPFACDHNRAPEYFAESVGTEVGFLSWYCVGLLQFVLGNCKPKQELVPMGEKCPNSTRGLYVTYTADSKPFALGPWTGSRYNTYMETYKNVSSNTSLPIVEMV